MPPRLLAALAALFLTSCATPQPCPVSGIAGLECHAGRGDKWAQLRLGMAYELGAGVPQDYARAARLYRAAATSTSGTTYVYSPPVGKSPGRVISFRTGADKAGLPEAKYRLARLYLHGLGVERDAEEARELMAEAAEAGFRPRVR